MISTMNLNRPGVDADETMTDPSTVSLASAAALEARGLTKQVSSPDGELTIVDDVNLSVASADTFAIVGASGAGKSTLLALLAGLDVPTSGEVGLDGAQMSSLDEDGRAALRAERVGFVFQSFHLIASLTAVENVMLPLELAGHERPGAAAAQALDDVGLAARRRHYPRQLSGGERQRVAIARAFVTSPAVLFADEPTGNLDTATGRQIANLLFDLNSARGTTLVLVTHDQALAERCATRREMAGGRLL